MVRLVERVPDTARDDVGMDDAVMMFYLGLVVFDHFRHRLWIVRNVFTDGEGSLRTKYNAAVREIRATRKRLEEPGPARHGPDPFEIYRALRVVNPSPYMYFLKLGDIAVVGSSPEMLLKVQGRDAFYRPIAGTRPRGRDEKEDQQMETER